MAFLIRNIKLPVTADEGELTRRIAEQCGVSARELDGVRLVRRALDARKRADVHFLVSAVVQAETKLEQRILSGRRADAVPYVPYRYTLPASADAPLPGRVAVAGLGPAGLFCALTLARAGYAPLVLERGEPVARRAASVERYWESGSLDPESNVMFGEGGAGTFSDGKLTSRSKDARGQAVLETLHAFGAPEEILYDAKPHIGTDRLRIVVSGIRGEIERLGGEVWFSSKLSDIETQDGRVCAVRVSRNGRIERVGCGALVLAVGQGARDTVRMLFSRGMAMQKKPFAVGVRVEHPQELIDRAQLGALAGHPRLGAASYALTGKSGGRGVYTFCMCPGGRVIAGASEPDQVVVNGMSDYARDGANANAAIVVQVRDDDTPDHPLAGLEWTERMERAAFLAGGGNACAPAERVADYLAHGAPGPFSEVAPTYRPGVTKCDLWRALPDFVAQGVCDGVASFAGQLRGFDLGGAVLTAAETRTSAPLRILRDETLQSVSHRGVYPVGEGAGYAGGIVSAAIDGMRAAEAVIAAGKPAR